MSNNRKYAQTVQAAFHAYVLNTFPAGKGLSPDEAKKIAHERADAGAKKVYDEVLQRGKPMGVWVQYSQQGHETAIHVFYHPNPMAKQIW